MFRKILSIASNKGKAFILLAATAFTVGGLLSAYLMYLIIDMVSNYSDYSDSKKLISCGVTLFAIIIIKLVIALIADLSKHLAGYDVESRIRENIVLKLKQFSLEFYTKQRLGEVTTIIHNDVQTCESVVGHFFSIMFSDILIALLLFIWLTSKNWKAGLAMVSFLPIAIIMLVFGLKHNVKKQNQTRNALSNMVSNFLEYAKGIPLLRAFSQNEFFEDKLKDSIHDFKHCAQEESKSIAMYIGRFSIFFELSYAVLILYSTLAVYNNTMDIPSFLLFAILSREFYKPFKKIESYWLDYIKVKDSYWRLERLMNTPVIPPLEHSKTPESFDIAFKNVDFIYDTNEFAIKNVSFQLPNHTLTALIGPSGSGKTTITNLLLRFWETQAGSIEIGGINIKDMDYDKLLSCISIVMQNVILFSGTIKDNILIGKHSATDEEVVEAAKKAQIHDFIVSLPDGYDTIVGENGIGLSGGEKQRISIARAFLKNSSIIILDEITSNVDPVNEKKIQTAINNLVKDRTVIMIAHHLRTILSAHQILVMENGSLVESGTFEELSSKNGLFSKLWSEQERN